MVLARPEWTFQVLNVCDRSKEVCQDDVVLNLWMEVRHYHKRRCPHGVTRVENLLLFGVVQNVTKHFWQVVISHLIKTKMGKYESES